MPVQENQDLEAGNTQRVFSLRFSPDNENIFLTAGWDNHIKVIESFNDFILYIDI